MLVIQDDQIGYPLLFTVTPFYFSENVHMYLLSRDWNMHHVNTGTSIIIQEIKLVHSLHPSQILKPTFFSFVTYHVTTHFQPYKYCLI